MEPALLLGLWTTSLLLDPGPERNTVGALGQFPVKSAGFSVLVEKLQRGRGQRCGTTKALRLG